jgi:NADH-quinone oxidoreductase subunit M
MILVLLLIIPLIGGLLAWVVSRQNQWLCRLLSLIALFADLALLAILSIQYASNPTEQWFAFVKWSWIPQLGVSFELGADGLSLLLLWLTVILGIFAVASSVSEIKERVGFFHFNLMLILVGIMGVFTALDLFLFYFFWELMLVPMYFMISIWGHENRVYASIKFFIFTQAGGLFMLLSILALYFIHGRAAGVYTFDYNQLLNTAGTSTASIWLMLGFFLAFAVKLPAVPIHTWLPDAHTEAPTAGSVILAGLLLKTGAYGLLRFVLPLFPLFAQQVAPVAMVLGVIGILYGAILAFAQRDAKRLVAYTSISHLGFVLFGIFAGNMLSLQGAVIIILAHGLSTGGLFILVGIGRAVGNCPSNGRCRLISCSGVTRFAGAG